MHRDPKKRARAWKPEDFMRKREASKSAGSGQSYDEMKSILWLTTQYMKAKSQMGQATAAPPTSRRGRR